MKCLDTERREGSIDVKFNLLVLAVEYSDISILYP